MTATADPRPVGELAFAAVMQGIVLYIAGQWLAERLVMRRHVALLGAGNGEYQAFVAWQQWLLDSRQDLIGVTIKARSVFGRVGIGNRLVMAVEQVFEADVPRIDICLEARGNLARAFPGEVIDTLVIVIQADFGEALADGLGLAFHLHRCQGQALGLLVTDRKGAAPPL